MSAKPTLQVAAVGAAACAACCAAPILGFLSAAGLLSLTGALAFGTTGLLVTLAVAVLLWPRRGQLRSSIASRLGWTTERTAPAGSCEGSDTRVSSAGNRGDNGRS
jgi:hypothetical protein